MIMIFLSYSGGLENTAVDVPLDISFFPLPGRSRAGMFTEVSVAIETSYSSSMNPAFLHH
jgi:hypothetical protein